MAYQHYENGTLVLDRPAAEELSKLMWDVADRARLGLPPTLLMVGKLEIAAAAMMPFPEEPAP